ncbi:hypothetical protein KJA15_02400 [Patescibacteria group bacterium]|nr:hypothetical protein [Patescibacteria group bacterium]
MIIKLQNLIGRTTHGLIALDMAIQDRPEDFKRYAKDFRSITKEEVDDAFYFLIPEARKEIWGRITEVQASLQFHQAAYKNQKDIYLTLKSLLDMMYAISKLSWR